MTDEQGGASEAVKARKAGKLRTGWIVIGVLAVLTLIEYWVAVQMDGSLTALAIIAVFKAGLILHYFMHLSQLWNDDEEGH